MAKAKACNHEHVEETDMRGYTGGVAVHPYTFENRAAHGAVTYTERCKDCAAHRKVNSNARHEEHGPWRLTGEV